MPVLGYINYSIILFSAHLKLIYIAKLVEFYLQWRRRYRGYRYSGTLFSTLYMSQLVL
jgi:hypothetical protein